MIHFLLKHRSLSFSFFTLVLLYLGADLFIPQALAAPDALTDTNTYVEQIASKLEVLHLLFNPLINFFSTHIGNFLGNDYIFAGIMGEMIKNIWVISRNLVNIFFVGALLWIAIKAIGGDFFGEETDLKKELLKIAVFLLLVNFSWLATKVVLDAANVATDVAFSIPSGVSNAAEVKLSPCTIDEEKGQVSGSCKLTGNYFTVDAKEVQNYTTEECVAQKIKDAYADVRPKGALGEINPNAKQENIDKFSKTSVFCWGNMDLVDYNQNTSVVYLTYGMANVQNLGLALSGDITQMAAGAIFSLVIQAAFVIALLALFLFMIIRMAMLWLFVGFSPVLVALLYLGGLENGSGMNFSTKDFLKWSFLPAQVGVILSVGFLMIAAGRASSQLLETLNNNVNLEGGIYNPASIFSGMGTLMDLIWLIIVLLVFAIAVYAPIKDMPFASTLINPIADFTKSTLTAVAKVPLVAPIIPTTDPISGQPGNPTSLRNEARNFLSALEFREGLSADTDEILRLERGAKELARMAKDNKSQFTRIVNEAKAGRFGGMEPYLPVNKVREAEHDHQENFINTGFADASEADRKLILEAIRKKGPVSTSATPLTPTSTPATTQINVKLQEGAKNMNLLLTTQQGQQEHKAIIEEAKQGNFTRLNSHINTDELKKLSQPEQDKFLSDAGVSEADRRTILNLLAGQAAPPAPPSKP